MLPSARNFDGDGCAKIQIEKTRDDTTCTYALLIQIRNGIMVSYTAYCLLCIYIILHKPSKDLLDIRTVSYHHTLSVRTVTVPGLNHA